MQAIILSRRDFREYDQIVSLYTKDQGKKELLARGVKKIISKNSAYLEPSTLVEFECVKGQEIDHLIHIQPVNLFKNIRLDFEKSLMVFYVSKTVDRLILGQQKDEQMYDLLCSWLSFLDKTEVVSDTLLYSFLLKLYDLLGFRPVLNTCIVKGENILFPTTLFFSPSLGGLVCADCQNIVVRKQEVVQLISQGEINNLQELLNKNWESVVVKKIDSKLKKLIEQLGSYHTEKRVFSWNNFKMNTALSGERLV